MYTMATARKTVHTPQMIISQSGFRILHPNPHGEASIGFRVDLDQGARTLGGVDTYLIHKTIAARVMTAR